MGLEDILLGMGLVSQSIAFIKVAMDNGRWKGVTENTIQDLESDVEVLKVQVKNMDDKMNEMEKEYSKALARIDENLIFVKETLIELKRRDK